MEFITIKVVTVVVVTVWMQNYPFLCLRVLVTVCVCESI